jgi:hypothetical protein
MATRYGRQRNEMDTVRPAHGRLRRPHEWDDDTAASVASIEIATRNMGDGTIEYIRRIKVWDKGKALEQLSPHLGLYRDQEPSEQPAERRLSHLTDEESIARILYLKGVR